MDLVRESGQGRLWDLARQQEMQKSTEEFLLLETLHNFIIWETTGEDGWPSLLCQILKEETTEELTKEQVLQWICNTESVEGNWEAPEVVSKADEDDYVEETEDDGEFVEEDRVQFWYSLERVLYLFTDPW